MWFDGLMKPKFGNKSNKGFIGIGTIFWKDHRVILMVDVGDLREGVLPEHVIETVDEIIDLPGIEFEGIGTNLGCYGGIMASYKNMKLLVNLAKDIEREYGFEVKTLSGGNSSTISLLERANYLPVLINSE